jgi:hypothetical protein
MWFTFCNNECSCKTPIWNVIHTIYFSLQCNLLLSPFLLTTCFDRSRPSSGVSNSLNCCIKLNVQLLMSHVNAISLDLKYIHRTISNTTTHGRSISKSWCRAPSGAHDQIFIIVWQLWFCFCGAPSLTRGRDCLLYMLLALVSAVFLGSKSLGSRDHILLSQFIDYPFLRLLRLAGSRWRYSTPPPHRSSTKRSFTRI